MDTLVIQTLNSIFYAAVLFLIAAGLSLIYGVMRIVNLAHGTFYALGAYVSAWAVGTAFGLGASGSGNLVLAGQLLLDQSGHRLAVAWLDDAGDTTMVSVYAELHSGWSLVNKTRPDQRMTRAILGGFDP